MKKHIINFARFAITAAFVVMVVSVAHAWTQPSAAPTGGNVPAPVNTGTMYQIKDAALGVQALIANLAIRNGGNTSGPSAFFGCGDANHFGGMFGCNVHMTDIFQALSSPVAGTTDPIGLRVDNNGATIANGGLYVSNPSGPLFPIFQAMKGTTGLNVDKDGNTILNGKLQYTGSVPGAGDVLVSDTNGNAAWQPIVSAASTVPSQPISIILWDVPGNNETASCPATHPILISSALSCQGGAQPESEGFAFLGNNGGSTGSVLGHCARSDLLTVQGKDVTGWTLICAKTTGINVDNWGIGQSGNYTATWHDIPAIAGNWRGKSCYQMLRSVGMIDPNPYSPTSGQSVPLSNFESGVNVNSNIANASNTQDEFAGDCIYKNTNGAEPAGTMSVIYGSLFVIRGSSWSDTNYTPVINTGASAANLVSFIWNSGASTEYSTACTNISRNNGGTYNPNCTASDTASLMKTQIKY